MPAPAPAPPPAPAAPVAPAPGTPPPAPAKPPVPSAPINDAFAEIDKVIKESGEKESAKRAAKPPVSKTEKPAKETVQPGEKPPAEKQAEPPKPAVEKPAEIPKPDETMPVSAPQLRAAYSELKKNHAAATEKLTAAEARLKELESIQEKLQSTAKRAEELEQQIKFVDYEKSPEYKEKYYKPFVDAYQTGRDKVSSLRTVERRDEMEEVTQPRRAGTAEDFDAIMRLADDGQAAELADQLFGPLSSVVMYHRERVMELNTARVNAIEEFKKTGGEREKEAVQRMQAVQEKARTTYREAVEVGISSHPEWFKPDEGDQAGAAMLEKGMKDADLAFSKNNLTPEQTAIRHAAFRNMAGAFPFMALKLHRANEKIAELEKALSEFKESEPNADSHKRDKNQPISAEDEIDNLAKSR